jgi:hypothetical protein
LYIFEEVDIGLGFNFNTWEEIVNKTLEDAAIIDNNLGPVEVSEGSLENNIFKNIWLSSLQLTCLSKHRLYGS